MKKFTRILAAALLVALVVSVMAVLPSFAASAASEDAPGFVTIYDMDTKYKDKTSLKPSNVATDDYPYEYPKLVKEEDGGRDVWNLNFIGIDAGGDAHSQDFLASFSDTWSIRVRDDAGYGTRAGGSKNTDYIIFDLDVATDTEFIDDIYWNLRLLPSAATAYNKGALGSVKYHPAIRRGDDGKIRVSNADGSNVLSAPIESDSKWTHITIVYDFHAYQDKDAEGNLVDAVANGAYVYINGYFAGNINALPATTSVFYFARMQTVNDNVLDMANESTKLANYTIKRVETGYNGMMRDSGVLGSGIPLWEIPELAYCMENAPAEPDGYSGQKLADILRGEEIIPVYDIDDLNGDLLDGDIVTVYKDIARMKSHLVVKKVAKTVTVTDEATGETTETVEDVSANIVWKDANGVELGAEGSLFAPPTILEASSDAAWAYVRGGAITSGGQSSYEGSGETAIISDPLWEAIASTGTMEVVLFEDYTMYGRSYGVEGSTSSASSGNQLSGGASLTFDLNGNSLTNLAKRTHLFIIAGAKASVTFKNGTLANNAGGNNLIMVQAYAGIKILVENCDVNIHGTIFDQRAGALYYVDSNITTYNYLTNTKATGSGGSAALVIGCTVDARCSSLINIAQTNESKVGRYGSATLGVVYIDTTVSGSASIYDGDIYADQGHASTWAYAQNKVNHYVFVDGCDISTTTRLTLSEVASVPATGDTVLTARVALELKNSKISATNLGYAWARTKNTEYVDYLQTVKVENCELDIAALSEGKSDAPATVVFEIAEGNKFAKMPSLESANVLTVNLPANAEFAYTSLTEGYDIVVTSSYESYTYKLGDAEPVPFNWNKPAEGTDEVKIEKLVTIAPDVAGAYKYSWAQDGNAFATVLTPDFALSAKLNLTLFSDIAMNLYIPKAEFDSETFEVEVVDAYGKAIAPEAVSIDGIDFYKFAAGAVAPTAAELDAATVNVTVKGAYGESFTESIGYSVADYLATYTPTDNAVENALIDAVINYILTAYEYAIMDTASLEALRPATEYTLDTAGAELDALAGVSVSVKFGKELAWLVKTEQAQTLKVTYTRLGAEVTEELVLAEGASAAIAVSAADFIAGITVSDGTTTAAVNLAGYYGALTDTAAQKMVVAIYNYAKCASDYRAAETV